VAPEKRASRTGRSHRRAEEAGEPAGQPGRFVGRPIEVTTAGPVRVRASFRLGDREYEVSEVLDTWQDHGFGMAAPLKKNWRLRHHRNYFRVRTAEGEVFELYLDRTRVGLRHGTPHRWFLYRQLPASP
jgi:hypothetical protein